MTDSRDDDFRVRPWPLPRFFGALGRTRKSSSRL